MDDKKSTPVQKQWVKKKNEGGGKPRHVNPLHRGAAILNRVSYASLPKALKEGGTGGKLAVWNIGQRAEGDLDSTSASKD